MKTLLKLTALAQLVLCVANSGASPAFEGTISATLTRGGQVTPLLYTIGTNCSRVEVTATDRPYPKDIVNLETGDIILLFPYNRSFVRLKPAAENQTTTPSGISGMPMPPGDLPPGIGPHAGAMPGTSGMSTPQNIGPTNLPGMPAMPMMPPMMMDRLELKATTDTTNLLGYTCTRYELNQRGEVMEIWATDKLLPFEPYQQNQPHRFVPRMIEEQWGELLKAKKLFPLLAVLRFETPPAPNNAATAKPGPERLRFEVLSVTPKKIDDDALFQPPPGYQEIQPLPF